MNLKIMARYLFLTAMLSKFEGKIFKEAQIASIFGSCSLARDDESNSAPNYTTFFLLLELIHYLVLQLAQNKPMSKTNKTKRESISSLPGDFMLNTSEALRLKQTQGF